MPELKAPARGFGIPILTHGYSAGILLGFFLLLRLSAEIWEKRGFFGGVAISDKKNIFLLLFDYFCVNYIYTLCTNCSILYNKRVPEIVGITLKLKGQKMSQIKKALIRFSLLGTIIFTGMSYAQIGQLDTLCTYGISGGMRFETVIRNKSQLTGFFNSTNCDYDNCIKTTSQPDFKKWTYLGITGWGRCIVIDILYGEDTVAVNYRKWVPPPCVETPCVAYAPPPPVAAIYFIPFTEKEIVFADMTGQIGK